MVHPVLSSVPEDIRVKNRMFDVPEQYKLALDDTLFKNMDGLRMSNVVELDTVH